MKFYLVQNVDRNEPEELKEFSYVHVKAKADGFQTVILSKEDLPTSELVQEMSKEAAQILLNAWIDEENQPPLPLDVGENEIRQSYINLEIYNG
jgi:hypothetical protein